MIPDNSARQEKPEGGSDRSFGLVMSVVFLAIALRPLLSHGTPAIWAAIVAVALSLTALLTPRVLSPLNRVWTRFGLLLHKITNPVLLAVVFFLVLTPTALAMKLFGKSTLRTRKDSNIDSYWLDAEQQKTSGHSMTNQF